MSFLKETIDAIKPLDEEARASAKARLDKLTMPHWALGRLMDLAAELAAMTGQNPPPLARKTIVTMAALVAGHGDRVWSEPVSFGGHPADGL